MKKIVLCGIISFLFMVTPMQSFAGPSVDIAAILRKCNAAFAGVNDYSCILHRKDVVNGTMKEHSNVLFQYKKPSRFYMKWLKYKIEAIYAEGKYNNKMVIHGGLLFNFVSIAVDPKAALKYSRHTLPEADIGHILKLVETNYRKAEADKDASVVFEQEEKLDQRMTWRFKAVFPADRDYYGHVIHINIDKELYLPIKIKVLGWKNELLEEYYYEDLKVNVGLTDENFDVNNKEYKFKVGY